MLIKFHDRQSIPCESLEYFGSRWLNETRAEVAPKTTGRRLISIRAFARWNGQPHILSDYRPPRPGKPLPHPIAEGKQGLLAMIEAGRNHNEKALVGLMGFCGLRIAEALSIVPASFNIYDMMLTVRGKGDKTRSVPVSHEAWGAVAVPYVNASVIGPDAPLITIKYRHAQTVIKEMGRRAGLSREIASHDLRHTYATLALDSGANLRTVQELMGHASASTTEGYTAVSVDAMRKAVEF